MWPQGVAKWQSFAIWATCTHCANCPWWSRMKISPSLAFSFPAHWSGHLSWRLWLWVALPKVPTSELGGQSHLWKSYCLVLLICFKSSLFFFLLSDQSSSCAVCATHKFREHKLLCWKATRDILIDSSSFNPHLLTVPSPPLSAFCSLSTSMHLHFYPTLGPTNSSLTSAQSMHWRTAQEW